jgi:hypothetical protein
LAAYGFVVYTGGGGSYAGYNKVGNCVVAVVVTTTKGLDLGIFHFESMMLPLSLRGNFSTGFFWGGEGGRGGEAMKSVMIRFGVWVVDLA